MVDKKEARDLTSLFSSTYLSLLRVTCNSMGAKFLPVRCRLRLVSAGSIRANKLASTWLDHVSENFADRVHCRRLVHRCQNGKEGWVKFIVENWITCLPD